MKVHLLDLNTDCTISGRHYPIEEVQKALDVIGNGKTFAYLTPTPSPSGALNLEDITHVVANLSIQDSVLTADVTLLETPKSQFVREFDAAGIEYDFRPVFVGQVDPKTMQAYGLKLLGVGVYYKEVPIK